MTKKQEAKNLNEWHCYFCGLIIDKDGAYASLVSHDKGIITHQDKWHRQCFKDWIQKKVEEKIAEYQRQAMSVAEKIAKQIQGNL